MPACLRMALGCLTIAAAGCQQPKAPGVEHVAPAGPMYTDEPYRPRSDGYRMDLPGWESGTRR